MGFSTTGLASTIALFSYCGKRLISRLTQRHFGLLTVLLTLLGFYPTALRADQSIILRSGNGVVGSQDAQVRFLAYGRTGEITPSAQDFESVKTGTFAYIDNPYPTYIQSLPTDPLANWVSTTSNLGAGTALYAVPFTVTDSVIGSASLDLGYAVDNAINGVYINGTLISGNSHDGDYHGEYYELRSDIASLLKPNAVNWLYVNASDYGGYAGIIFNATILVQGGAAATPSISPDKGGNTGSVTVRIIGSGFQPAQPNSIGSQIKVTGIGPDIIGSNTTVISPNVLTTTLNLLGAAPGLRTVTFTNPDGDLVSLQDAFTVLPGGGANLQIHKVANEPVAGYNNSVFITVTNTGTVDSGVTPINEVLAPYYTYVSTDQTPTSIEQESNPIAGNVSPDSYVWNLEWDLPKIAAGSTVNLAYTANLNKTYPGGPVTSQGVACLNEAGRECRDEFITCVNVLGSATIAGTVGCVIKGKAFGGWKSCLGAIGLCVGARVACAERERVECAAVDLYSLFAKDPNSLQGPPGYGPSGWFIPPTTFQYALSFQNEVTATKAATDVYLNEVFDPAKFDLMTLTLSSIVVGDSTNPGTTIPLTTQPFTRDIDLRPALQVIVRVSVALDQTTNQVKVSFVSLDPTTGMAPTDGTVGFLPPGAGGTILFTVNPKPGLSTGTAIQSSGSVVFDSNAAIKTNRWLNTVDIIPPISQVVSLPATETATTFKVSWTGTDVGSGIEYYTIYVSDNGAPFTAWLTQTTDSSEMYTGMIGHTYSFYSIGQDFAMNQEAAKTVADTSTVVVAKGSQSITFGTIADKVYGVAPFTLKATASSGLPVSYTVTGPATLSGSQLTITGVGLVTVTASQPGNSNYAPAAPVARSFTVLPAALKATADNKTRAYGAANPKLTYTLSGFVNGEGKSVVSGTATLATTATSTSLAGLYPITFATQNLTATNYTVVYVPGTLTVTGGQQTQTITFGPLANQVYGAAPIALAATASSGLPVSYSITGPASLSGTSFKITGAGSVSVTASQAGNASYSAASPVTQKFMVAKAALTATANSVSIPFGSTIPSLTYSVAGFVNGDTSAAVGGTATLTTTATVTSPVGPYPITFSTAALTAANYSFTYVSGTLTVTSSGTQCTVIDYSKGFTGTGMTVNGSAKIGGGLLQLTGNTSGQRGSAFYSTRVPISSFTTDFTFQLTDAQADGFTFVIQGGSPTALGAGGQGLGYKGIANSVAIKFDLYNNAGEGGNSTGSYINGANPTVPSVSLAGSGINLHSGHVFALHLAYDGSDTIATLTDTVTKVVLTAKSMGNVAAILGTDTAYFGFAGGTGRLTAKQSILTWSYSGGSGCAAK